ncbi:MAG: dihydrolipoyllysine-residue acetyltransferase [Candidatus Hydrogenedentota bacterium]
MATEIKLPELGEGVTEGTVSQILVSKGDTIEEGQGIIELESDKAVAEIPSTESGTVQEIRVEEGQTVHVGDVIIVLDGAAKGASGKAEKKEEKKAEKPSKPEPDEAEEAEETPDVTAEKSEPEETPDEEKEEEAPPGGGGRQEVPLPELGEGVTEGTVSQILVSEGDTIEEGQSLIELESDKAVAEIPSPVSGKIIELRIEEGQTVHVGDIILVIEGGGEPAKKPATEKKKERPALQVIEKPKEKDEEKPAARRAEGREEAGKKAAVLTSPTVRRLARELGVNLDNVPTADPSGRVTAQDVRDFAEGKKKPADEKKPAPKKEAAAATTEGKWGAERREGMSQIRKKTAERMLNNWTGIPHVTHHDKADITEIETMRKKYGKKVEEAGGKLTVTAILVKVVAEALKRFEKFNASVDMDAQEVIYKQYYNVGVAVDTPNGLLVPVIRDADQKSLTEVCIEMPALARKARDRKLSLEDMQGGTFTISNVGGIGGTAFTPIINGPEVSILGVSRSSIEPVHINGQFAPRMMMPLSLSYDHRLIDGAEAARFTRWLCEAIEQPWILFLDD